MSRDEFIDWLARLVADEAISEDEASELLALFDAGEFGDWQPPMLPSEAVRGLDNGEVAVALAALLLFLPRMRRPTRLGPPLTAVNRIQDAFAQRVRGLAGMAANGQLTLADWHRQMLRQVEHNLIQQAAAGSGSQTLTTRQLLRIDELVRQQSAYLSRFADHVALGAAQGAAWSAERIAARAELYGGAGRGLYFEEAERAALEDGLLGGGWLIYYLSRDDRSTCSRCLNAERAGPYLPGSNHAVPGSVCQGGARCRCRLEWRYDLARWQEMTGRRAA